MEPDVQQLGIDIQRPPGSPKRWEQLVADAMACVEPVREKVEQGGVSDAEVLDRIQTACAAALLAERLRDVRVDVIEHERLYIPADVAAKHRLDLPLMRKALTLDADRGCDGDLRDGSCDCALIPRGDMLALRQPFRATMRELVGRTYEMFSESRSPWRALPPAYSQPLQRLIDEGQSTLRLIARHDYDTLTRRPKVGAFFHAWDRLRARLGR
tara:strand:- start:581 stop:1219 length:639 start_codon:yes stop_codon:yes gene_type:complete